MLHSFEKSAALYPYQLGADNTACISQLITTCADRVHPVPNDIESFADNRVGTINDNKQTWVSFYGGDMRGANQDTDNDGRHLRLVEHKLSVEAALYTYCTSVDIQTEQDLPGNVGQILSMPVQSLDDAPSAMIFYSISSFGPGAGARLIDRVYHQFTGQSSLWLATLSPLRGLASWVEDKYGESTPFIKCKHMRTKLALDYLSNNQNPVQKFHMKNGAYIGDIKLNANLVGSDDYNKGLNVMVNYVYPAPAQRMVLKDEYAKGNLTFAPHLYDEISRMGDLKAVRKPESQPKTPWGMRPSMF